jgi:hypothetical protein
MVEKLHAAVAHEHKLRFLSSPTEHASIKLLMRSISRKYTRPRSAVTPLNTAHLRLINEHLQSSDSSNNLALWRTVWRMNLLYYRLSRFSEINCLTTSDIKFIKNPELCLAISISKSKTDQNGHGDVKYVYSLPENPLMCPVLLTQNYLERLKDPNSSKPYVGKLQPRVHFKDLREIDPCDIYRIFIDLIQEISRLVKR